MNDERQDPKAGRVSRRRMLALAAGAAISSPALAATTKGAATVRMNDLVSMDAAELAGTIHSRRASCTEVMSAYLDHIENFNPKVNAIVALQDRADLLRQARQRDAELARGESRGPLHGFPHAVKEVQAVKGMRTTMGSPIFKDFVSAEDGLMVSRLRISGAIIIGKTNMPEFGLGSHTFNPIYGATRNAFDQSLSAGGSSGGAAVALALRMLPVADGSDYGGSLRNPAGWNNVFGFRTSFGLIPTEARDAWLPSMGVTGPMARTVTDLAMLLAVQAGFDARVPLSMAGDGAVFQGRLEAEFKGKRIAWGADFKGHTPCEAGVFDTCRTALRAFESLGCSVEPAVPEFDFDALWQAAIRLRGWQQGGSLLEFYDDSSKRGLLKPEAIYEVETGMRQSGYDITAASMLRTSWYQTMRRFFERYDYFVLPTAQVFPFEVGQHWPQQIDGKKMSTYHEWMKANLLVTMSGCPALAMPAGFNARGLPMGIQIIGPHRRELDCLRLAYAYELAANWTRAHVPPLLNVAR